MRSDAAAPSRAHPYASAVIDGIREVRDPLRAHALGGLQVIGHERSERGRGAHLEASLLPAHLVGRLEPRRTRINGRTQESDRLSGRAVLHGRVREVRYPMGAHARGVGERLGGHGLEGRQGRAGRNRARLRVLRPAPDSSFIMNVLFHWRDAVVFTCPGAGAVPRAVPAARPAGTLAGPAGADGPGGPGWG